MRILVISNLYPPDVLGGYEMACQQAADALREAGHDVFVLTTVPRAKPVPSDPHVGRRLRLTDVYDGYVMDRVGAVGHAVHRTEAHGVQAFNVHVLGQAVEEFGPDVAYVWNVIGLGGLGMLAALQHLGVPWVMHLGDCVPRSLCALGADHPSGGGALAEAFNRLCRGRFICCSRTVLDEVEAGGVRIAGRTALLPNWVVTPGSPGRTGYAPGGRLRLVTAGSFGTHKGTDIVIKAAGLLRDRGRTNFSVDLYGIGSDHVFWTMIHSEHLDMVRICGFRTQAQLDELYPQYDVFLFPTWAREPFGIAPIEAMAHGCVAVMSRLCGLSEWFIGGVDCLKIDRDPGALADAIELILDDLRLLETVGRRGRSAVLRWCHLSAILPGIERELAAAVRAGGGPRRPAAEAHRVALLAEKMFRSIVYETVAP